MNLIVQKDSLVVLTDSQIAVYNNVTVEKGAALIAVPDSATTDERLEAAREASNENPGA